MPALCRHWINLLADTNIHMEIAQTSFYCRSSQHQQAESSLEADDILAAEATDMNEYTTSDLSVLSEPPNHNDVSHSRDCDLHALFSGRDDAFPKQARSHMFAQACSDPWLDQMVRYSRD